MWTLIKLQGVPYEQQSYVNSLLTNYPGSHTHRDKMDLMGAYHHSTNHSTYKAVIGSSCRYYDARKLCLGCGFQTWLLCAC